MAATPNGGLESNWVRADLITETRPIDPVLIQRIEGTGSLAIYLNLWVWSAQ